MKKKKNQKDKIIITCGTFDPISAEDIKYLQKCKEKGDWLVVGLHSDLYLSTMRGGFLQGYSDRKEIISQLKVIDEIFNFDDKDGTVRQLLKLVKYCYPNATIVYVSEEDMKDLPESKITGILFETMKEE